MITIRIDNAWQECPSSWNELTRRQLIYIAGILFRPGIIQWHQKIATLMILLFYNFRTFSLKFFWAYLRIRLINMKDLLKATNFIWQSNDLTTWPVKSIRIGLRRYYPPADILGNLTIYEFAAVDSFYELFRKYAKMEYLEGMAAVLYRPLDKRMSQSRSDYRGDLREAFNEFRVREAQKRMSRLSDRIKFAIYLQYDGNRRKMINQYQNLFTKEENRQAEKTGWGKIIMTVAGGLDKYKVTKETNVYDFFNQLVINAERMEKVKK